jgi:hypothetical protein
VASQQWNRPRQWEVINEMRLGTWNVRTLYRGGEMNELVKRKDKYEVDTCVLQEIVWLEKGNVRKKNRVILRCGHKSDKLEFGREFYFSRHIMDYIFKRVDNFKYLGTMVNKMNNRSVEVNA